MSDFREESEKHWSWLDSTLGKIYVDALEHGFGHGKEYALIIIRNLYDQGLITPDDWETIRREIEK